MAVFDYLGTVATLAIVKPEAFAHRQDILRIAAQHGLESGPATVFTLRQPQAEEFYDEHCERGFFAPYTKHMCSGPVLVVMLSDAQPNIALQPWQRWRKLIGPYTDPPAGTIRSLYGQSVELNAVHGSDGPDAARRELLFFFSLATIINYLDVKRERQAQAAGG